MNDVILLAFYILLVGAALQDIAALKISNLFPIATIMLFGVWLFANGLPTDIWQNGVRFLLIAALGIGLFAAGWLGGGDVKLLAAGALWFDLSGGLWLFIYMSLSGGLLSLLLVFGRRIIPAAAPDKLRWPALRPKGPIPYGIAISTGIALALALHGPDPSGRKMLPDVDLSAFPAAKADR